ncbi:hypothetical protein RRG08_061075 [Elysia crispata]|uniref:Uncharacterized protein n=1 Tax=Elysia crispata TaxID=231223 RepID=A0AAE0YVV4_9GAST|nr:hypothetical protein RRG08_061075 [Elysia crispata]
MSSARLWPSQFLRIQQSPTGILLNQWSMGVGVNVKLGSFSTPKKDLLSAKIVAIKQSSSWHKYSVCVSDIPDEPATAAYRHDVTTCASHGQAHTDSISGSDTDLQREDQLDLSLNDRRRSPNRSKITRA